MATRSLALVGLVVVAAIAVAVVRTMWPVDGRSRATIICCCLFVLIYVPWMTASSLSTAISPTSSRFLSPIYVPLLVIAAGATRELLARSDRILWQRAVGALVAVGLLTYAFASVRDTKDDAAHGIQLNADVVVDSDLAAAALRTVRESPSGAVVYSNSPNALWAATAMQPIYFSPRDRGTRQRPVTGQLDAFAQQLACTQTPAYLVLYRYADDRFLRLEEIKAAVDVKRVAATNDGTILQVTSRDGTPCTGQAAHAVR
jgi:hypothetical protein